MHEIVEVHTYVALIIDSISYRHGGYSIYALIICYKEI